MFDRQDVNSTFGPDTNVDLPWSLTPSYCQSFVFPKTETSQRENKFTLSSLLFGGSSYCPVTSFPTVTDQKAAPEWVVMISSHGESIHTSSSFASQCAMQLKAVESLASLDDIEGLLRTPDLASKPNS